MARPFLAGHLSHCYYADMTAAGRQAGVRAAERSMRARKRASEVAAPSTWEVPALPTTTPRMVNATKTTWYESILQKKKPVPS